MRLVSLKRHAVELPGATIFFDQGEHIVTEYSHKYSIDSFQALAAEAGWTCDATWVDEKRLFSVHFLTVSADYRQASETRADQHDTTAFRSIESVNR
jgi:uncharacterized SAM-dependent methyltransferase